MRSDIVRLFQTLPHACGYFAERTSQNLVIDPGSPQLADIYELSLQRGYRRAGGHVYVPRCVECRACVACRIPVADFRMDRTQRRCAKRNADLELKITPAEYSEERFELYRRYLQWRHPNGGMDDAQTEDFSRFLYTSWSPTRFIELRKDGRLLAVAVTDFCNAGLSSVYTFYDPEALERGLGTFAILEQIRLAREHALAHVYLGFWIAGHPKMDYKIRFRPIEVLRAGEWVVLEKQAAQENNS
ncbi:arginyltransferase [Dokdonella sp.]|uniref:arginyltransferase n=1 Tax=Dokdonella sp. TaxID=2291710 RepID=UPI003C32213E